MKKTISSLALLVAAQGALALPEPPVEIPPERPQKMCLQYFQHPDGSITTNTSRDQTRNNTLEKKKIYANGCAAGQVAVIMKKSRLDSGEPPGVVQL